MTIPEYSRRGVLDPIPPPPEPTIKPGGRYRVCRVEHGKFTLPIDGRRFENFEDAWDHLQTIQRQYATVFGTFGVQEIYANGKVSVAPGVKSNFLKAE